MPLLPFILLPEEGFAGVLLIPTIKSVGDRLLGVDFFGSVELGSGSQLFFLRFYDMGKEGW